MAKKINRRAMKEYEAWYAYTDFFGNQKLAWLGTISARSEYEAKNQACIEYEGDYTNPTCIYKRYPESIIVKHNKWQRH